MTDRFALLTKEEREALAWAAWVSRLDNNVSNEVDELLSRLWDELEPEPAPA